MGRRPAAASNAMSDSARQNGTCMMRSMLGCDNCRRRETRLSRAHARIDDIEDRGKKQPVRHRRGDWRNGKGCYSSRVAVQRATGPNVLRTGVTCCNALRRWPWSDADSRLVVWASSAAPQEPHREHVTCYELGRAEHFARTIRTFPGARFIVAPSRPSSGRRKSMRNQRATSMGRSGSGRRRPPLQPAGDAALTRTVLLGAPSRTSTRGRARTL